MESSISLEETNKIRVSLGLKPLVDDGAPVDVKQKAAEDNYAETREREKAAKRTSEIVARIEKKKNQRELHKRLAGATLGDEDPDADDTAKWIKKSKKREKELAKKRLQALDALDNIHQEEYTEKDLAGLKVSHDLDALEDGEDRILTLKDSRILDNEEDELQNVDMAEDEGDQRRHELKTKKRDYTGYDDDEFGPGAVAGMKRNVLAKYDEDINGPSETGFRLGGALPVKSKADANQSDGQVTVNKSLLSIDYAKNQEMSDYLQEGDVGFKKPKTKKKRATRRQPEADPSEPSTSSMPPPADTMEVDVKPVIPNMDANFVDDDDLQAVLAQARRRKLTKKAKTVTAEEIAEKVAQERLAEQAAQEAAADAPPEKKPGVLEFDDTSEFVRSITYTPAAPVKMEPIIVKIDTRAAAAAADNDDDDEDMEQDEAIGELEVGEHVKEEEMDEDETTAMLNAIEDAIKTSEGTTVKTEEPAADAAIGTATQQTFRSGMASTLNILRQQGLLQGASKEVLEREETQKAKDAWLAQYRHRIAQRELEKLRQRNAPGKDQAQREWENRQREQTEAREALDLFSDYKPDVEIRYHDEDGRVLTTKEAWKALSHKFHGKGSGRMKTEKRLKKIAEEKKREAMGSGDTPLSMQAAFQIRQEKAGQAHMVLSVGNRGAVPQASEFLDAPLTKKEKGGKGKKKDVTKPAQVHDMTGFTANSSHISAPILGADAIVPIPSGSSGAIIAGEPTAAPPIRSGFTRIGGADAASASPATGSPVPDDRGKVAFGFSAIGKRKAGDEGSAGPAPKRR